MLKRLIRNLCLVMIMICSLYINKTYALNNIIDVGIDVYVQHDTNNGDVYILNKEGIETTVYKIVNVTYTASKQWTKDGLYIDDLTGKVGATAPNNYISVKEGEVYFVRLYGIGDVYRGENGNEWHVTTPIVYFDDFGNCVGSALSGTYSSSKKGVEITIPSGATRMYISNYNNQNISIQKKMILNEEDFNTIKSKQNQILNNLDTNYENIINDQIIYSNLDKAYITFVNDDSRPDIDKFADLFISKNIPLTLATVADNLLNASSNLKETRLEVATRVEKAGGEILAHNAPVITNDTIDNTNFMYNYFVVQKQLLTSMGFNVNGIILAGGNGQITGNIKTAKWASLIYNYSDLLGEKYDTYFGSSVYFYPRTGLSNYHNDIFKIKQEIDKAIEEKTWKVFYFHDTSEISLDVLEEILDYINSKSDEVEVVTYKNMYDKFATRYSNIKDTKTTYYVSSNGTSKDGTDINNPMSLDTLNNKIFKSGDTILLKAGDTFFGTLNLNVYEVDDTILTISRYGEGENPTISAYKEVSKEEAWEVYNDEIYRIDLTNIENFNGINNIESNIGFIEDNLKNKYYNKKNSLLELKNKYDFYCDDKYLYIKIDKNPYLELGTLKLVPRVNLMTLFSNLNINNINFSYSGGHGLVGATKSIENVTIENCIIENIGGSYLKGSTRYGNGIEFYGSDTQNIIIRNNIIRNIYDVAFTIQGTSGSGTDIFVYHNVFVNNSQDSEIWESGSATGVVNYQFYNNLSINQGRGWGYDARDDKYAAAHILFWGYNIKNTDISFYNNTVYNPKRIYFIEKTNGTNIYFKENDIKSNNNIYYFNTDMKLYRDEYNYENKDTFIKEFNKDANSKFISIIPDENIILFATISNDIRKIRSYIIEDENYIEKITLLNLPNNIEIKQDDTLDISNFILKLEYTNGYTKQIDVQKDMIKNLDTSIIGKQIVIVNYEGKETTFEINVLSKEDDKEINDSNNNVEDNTKEDEKNDSIIDEIINDSEENNDIKNNNDNIDNNKKQDEINNNEDTNINKDNILEDEKKDNINNQVNEDIENGNIKNIDYTYVIIIISIVILIGLLLRKNK